MPKTNSETLPPIVMLPKTDSFFRTLIQNSTDVFQLADYGLNITYISDAVTQILGYSPHEFINKSTLDLIHPDDKEHVRDWFISIRTQPNRSFVHEYRLKNAAGDWVWIENNAKNMLDDESLRSIVMNYRNIQAKKGADHALVQTEQRLSLLLNNTEESFIILNSRLRIITYNRAAQEHSPYFFTQELQSGLSVLDLVSKDEASLYIFLFEQVFAGKQMARETKFIDDNGHSHIFNHTFRPLFDANEDIFGVFITSSDITERKKLTEELAANTQRLNTAQQIAHLGYYEYDYVSKTTFASDEFCNIIGISNQDNNSINFSLVENVSHPKDKVRVQNEIARSIRQGKHFNIEFRIITNEQEKVIMAIGDAVKSEKDELEKFRVTLQDITESKMVNLAIQTLEGRFKSLFENSIDGVVLSKAEGDIISANPSICNLLGYTQDEITQLNRWDIVVFDSDQSATMMDVREKVGSYIGELLMRHKDGRQISVEITSIKLADAKGQDYISSIIRDITEKKKIEREQKALTEELLKNNQDLQQFSFITSHNLRAPVANLISLLSLYNKENPQDEFNKLLIEKFEEATQQLNQTLNDLVNVLVIKSNNNIEKESIHFSSIFKEVKKNIENLLEEQNGTVVADFTEVDDIMYNRIHLESIFLNMLTNAIRYRSPEKNPAISIRSYKSGDWVVVEFTDNGLGMDLKRYGDRLFGLYQRFHSNKEGKGLGLYMTRSQVVAMGGKIEVESEPGVGTTFKIYFKS